MDTQSQIDDLKKRLDTLTDTASHNDFSDLKIFTKKVRFNSDVDAKTNITVGGNVDITGDLTVTGTITGAELKQYQTTLTEDNNTGSSSTNYTQNITGLSFAPHTVIFTGTHDNQTVLYGIDGIATKNGNITTGNCRWFKLGSAASIGQSTSKLGTTNANDYFTVSAWNSDGVTISKTLFGSYGSGNDKFAGILTLLG